MFKQLGRPGLISRSLVIGTLALAVSVILSPATAFTGSLSSIDLAIHGTGNWIVTGPTSIDWTVTQNDDLSWHYSYVFSHPEGETSHLILEVSEAFTYADIWDAGGDFDGEIEIGPHTSPSMPEDIYGIKFEGASGLTSDFWFNSSRAPVWGDFYAKDGDAGGHGRNSAWNAGFAVNDWDPPDSPGSGSIGNHLLVPDTFAAPIPEPSVLLLLGASIMAVVVARRKLG